MKKFIILCATLLMFGCNNSSSKKENYDTTEAGLSYLYREKSSSDLLPQDGNKLLVNVKYYDSKDSLLFNSEDYSSRFIMDFFPPVAAGTTINDAFAMMHEGDSISFRINAYNFFLAAGQKQMLSKITKTDTLRFEIRLKKILSPDIIEKEIAQKDKELKDEEEYLLADFLKNNYPELKPTKSGLYFIETQEGEGPQITKNNKVAIHYTATYINGEPIYSTYQKNDPLVFEVADPLVWPCLAEAVQYMKKGSKATIIAPSKLAAGERGDKSLKIAPRKTIIFDLELIAYK
ncbi:MAG: FKBP-type peptidyl-prolyl cis-trans isomerase [Bacteroidales bacterium]|nr:FKBP-type peptidyl-prolyl cis-trans isomerase [Bacteroidales bacterium]